MTEAGTSASLLLVTALKGSVLHVWLCYGQIDRSRVVEYWVNLE